MDFEEVQNLYRDTLDSVELTIDNIFALSSTITNDFIPIILITAVIYIALMGYALMSGWIVMSGREAVVRLSKVVLIIVLTRIFTGFAPTLYGTVWAIPEGIGDLMAGNLNPILGLFGSDFDLLINVHAERASQLGQKIVEHYDQEQQNLAIGAWAIAMAPVFVIMISIILAKVISAILFMIAPVVFVLSLLGIQNNYLMAWVKGIALTFLTVIIVYIIATVVIDIISPQIFQLINAPYAPDEKIGLIDFAPLGILCVFGVILVGQATTIASSLIGTAAVNTQQATGFMQIGALQGAARVGA